MNPQIDSCREILTRFLISRELAQSLHVDREMVVSHATLSALAHHWPSRADGETLRLLNDTRIIRELEQSRWLVQRRIAIAKLHRFFESAE